MMGSFGAHLFLRRCRQMRPKKTQIGNHIFHAAHNGLFYSNSFDPDPGPDYCLLGQHGARQPFNNWRADADGARRALDDHSSPSAQVAAMGDQPVMDDASHFQAYTIETVATQSPRKVESLCAWGTYLLAGLSDGSLLIYRQQDFAAEGTPRWQVRSLGKQA
jgi:hypothetical protein